jgi:hypothetical protein
MHRSSPSMSSFIEHCLRPPRPRPAPSSLCAFAFPTSHHPDRRRPSNPCCVSSIWSRTLTQRWRRRRVWRICAVATRSNRCCCRLRIRRCPCSVHLKRVHSSIKKIANISNYRPLHVKEFRLNCQRYFSFVSRKIAKNIVSPT